MQQLGALGRGVFGHHAYEAVALELGRHCILCDSNAEAVEVMRARLNLLLERTNQRLVEVTEEKK